MEEQELTGGIIDCAMKSTPHRGLAFWNRFARNRGHFAEKLRKEVLSC
jgi:hypothetical protein